MARVHSPGALLRAVRRYGICPLALLVAVADGHGERIAWLDAERSVTFTEVLAAVRAAAVETSPGRARAPEDPLAAVVGALATVSTGGDVVLSTTGSTQDPKPVTQSAGWAATAQRLSLLGALPAMRHPSVAGLAPTVRGHGLALVLSTWAMAGTFVWLDGWVPQRSVDIVSGTPLQLREALESGVLDGMRIALVLSGSDALDPALVDALALRTGAPVWDSYGATEVGSVAIASPDQVAAGTQGRVLAGVRVEVLDEGCRVVPRGVPGTLSITTRWSGRAFRGDRGVIDEAGRVVVMGRCDGQFNSGAVLVSPERVERWMLAQPDVESATVTTVGDDRFGHRLLVTFHGPADPGELRDRCRDALGSAHTPVRIERVTPPDH